MGKKTIVQKGGVVRNGIYLSAEMVEKVNNYFEKERNEEGKEEKELTVRRNRGKRHPSQVGVR